MPNGQPCTYREHQGLLQARGKREPAPSGGRLPLRGRRQAALLLVQDEERRAATVGTKKSRRVQGESST